MKFIYTPEEALSIAQILFDFLKSQSFTVSIDQALNDEAPCSTTLIAKKAELSILFEAQNQANCDQYLKDLALWLNNHRFYAELFIATHRDASFSGSFFKQLDQTGIGLILIEDSGSVKIERQPRNPALIVSPAPTLKFGKYKQDIMAFLAKFNQPNSFLSPDTPRKDALRDVCELVEGLTEDVAITAAKKCYLLRDEQTIQQTTWSNRINVLAAPDAYAPNYSPFVTEELKTDLHSFRNGRNLVDHRVRSKREEVQRQQKFQDRMITGVRLVADLVSLKTKISRKKKLSP